MIQDNPYVIAVIALFGGMFLGWLFWSDYPKGELYNGKSYGADALLKLNKALGELRMKNSEAKQIVANAAGKSREALGEIGTKISALQTQIDDLIAGAGDPEITDEEFLKNLNTLKADTEALADIVPNPTPPVP